MDSCREEGWNLNWLLSSEQEVQMKITGHEYNVTRPHAALGHVPATGGGSSSVPCRSTEVDYGLDERTAALTRPESVFGGA